MPKILFASNSISHFPGSVVSSRTQYFDGARVPYAINSPVATVVGSPEFNATTTDETWFHFRGGADAWPNNYADRFFEVNAADGTQIFYLAYDDSPDDGYYMSFLTQEGTRSGQFFLPWANGQFRTFDIQLLYTGIQATARLYVNEILILTLDGASSGVYVPRTCRFGGNSGDQNTGFFFSEVIVADGDTRNARLDLLRPTAAGVHQDWLGPLGYLADDDPTTGMTTLAALEKQTTVLTPYTGAQNVSNVVQVTTTVRGINSPDLLRHIVRLTATDYESGDFSVPFEKDYQITDWSLNPATGVPWSSQDLANAEFGFVSDETP